MMCVCVYSHMLIVVIWLICFSAAISRHIKTPPEVRNMLWEGAALAANRVFVEGWVKYQYNYVVMPSEKTTLLCLQILSG